LKYHCDHGRERRCLLRIVHSGKRTANAEDSGHLNSRIARTHKREEKRSLRARHLLHAICTAVGSTKLPLLSTTRIAAVLCCRSLQLASRLRHSAQGSRIFAYCSLTNVVLRLVVLTETKGSLFQIRVFSIRWVAFSAAGGWAWLGLLLRDGQVACVGFSAICTIS
jgi:hypothetical protein